MVESGLLVFILALAGVGFSILRRPEAGPTAFWTWGCFALFGSGLCIFILAEFRWSVPVGHALATAYPVFLWPERGCTRSATGGAGGFP